MTDRESAGLKKYDAISVCQRTNLHEIRFSRNRSFPQNVRHLSNDFWHFLLWALPFISVGRVSYATRSAQLRLKSQSFSSYYCAFILIPNSVLSPTPVSI